jgi:pimeloyl-ACP methyl ester carboxylesterase
MMKKFWRHLVLICAAGIAVDTALAQDYDRENRWRAEIEPTVIVGDAVDLVVESKKVFSIFTEGRDKTVAIVLVHGVGVHPDFGLIGKLRTQLAETGYATLSVQMPVLAKEITDANAYRATFGNAALRLDAAAAWLKAKGYTKLILASHSMGAWMANVYFENAPVTPDGSPYRAWACIGITGRIGSTGSFEGPILDLSGENDLKPTLDAAWLRKLKLFGRAGSETVITPGANHYFENKEVEATKAIAAFVARVVK